MDLDNIIKALEICSTYGASCDDCPYHAAAAGCSYNLKINALAALKELHGGNKSAGTDCGTVTEMQGEIDAQAQAIETLHLINAKLEGKVEAYENMLRCLAKE